MFLTTYCNTAIYCNTLKGNTQYGIDPYCYIPMLQDQYNWQNTSRGLGAYVYLSDSLLLPVEGDGN